MRYLNTIFTNDDDVVPEVEIGQKVFWLTAVKKGIIENFSANQELVLLRRTEGMFENNVHWYNIEALKWDREGERWYI